MYAPTSGRLSSLVVHPRAEQGQKGARTLQFRLRGRTSLSRRGAEAYVERGGFAGEYVDLCRERLEAFLPELESIAPHRQVHHEPFATAGEMPLLAVDPDFRLDGLRTQHELAVVGFRRRG